MVDGSEDWRLSVERRLGRLEAILYINVALTILSSVLMVLAGR